MRAVRVAWGGRRRTAVEAPAAPGRACEAPFAAIHLDPRGDVRACCHQGRTLGNVATASLAEIWRGVAAGRLRSAVDQGDLTRGCTYCAWAQGSSAEQIAFARKFDAWNGAGAAGAKWPRYWHLALSSSCNLMCTMCSGELSSAIRARREHLPPLPKPYGDRFFAELAVALPHADEVEFTGGEPFLGAETLRVWDEMLRWADRPRVSVVTNGTQWGPRVHRWVTDLRMNVTISLDAISGEALERIRVGADAPELLRNVDQFHEACRSVGAELRLAFCLMRTNWEELAPVLAFGEERGLRVDVNVVDNPAPESLLWLPREELGQVVAGLERATSDVVGRLGLNAGTWTTELSRLRAHLADSGEVVGPPPSRDGILELFADEGPVNLRPAHYETRASVDELRRWVGGTVEPATIRIDADGALVEVGAGSSISTAFHLLEAPAPGEPLSVAYRMLAERFGVPGAPEFVSHGPSRVDFTNRFGGPQGLELRVVASAERDGSGRISSVTLVGVARRELRSPQGSSGLLP